MTRSSASRFIVALVLAYTAASARGEQSFNVKSFGAVGDGIVKDTGAFQKALDTCAISGGGEVIVPAGKFLIGSVQVGTRTILRLEKDSVITGSPDLADYPMMDVRWEGRWQSGHRALIYFGSVDHVGIVGPGLIEGNPAVAASQNPRGAVVLEPIHCNDVRWEGFTVTQGGNWATHPTYCADVQIRNLTIRGGRDGIDVDSCKRVRIEDCNIDSGDDCISLKSGRGADGARVGRPTEDVLITGCTMRGRSFACIGIGSEISAGVRRVRIEHCKLTSRTFGLYLKSRIGRSGMSEEIIGDDLDILGGGFLKINLVGAGNTNTYDDPVEGDLGIPGSRDLRFSNVRLNNATKLVDATEIPDEKPLQGLTLTNITGTASKGMTLRNITNASLSQINVTGVTDALLAIDKVTGTGLEGAVRFVPTTRAATRAAPRGTTRPAQSPATRANATLP